MPAKPQRSTPFSSMACRIADICKPNTTHNPLPKGSEELSLTRLDKFRNAAGSTPTAEIRGRMQRTMQKHCAVFRDNALAVVKDEGVLPNVGSPGQIRELAAAGYRRYQQTLGTAGAVDFDEVDDRIYFADVNAKTIYGTVTLTSDKAYTIAPGANGLGADSSFTQLGFVAGTFGVGIGDAPCRHERGIIPGARRCGGSSHYSGQLMPTIFAVALAAVCKGLLAV